MTHPHEKCGVAQLPLTFSAVCKHCISPACFDIKFGCRVISLTQQPKLFLYLLCAVIFFCEGKVQNLLYLFVANVKRLLVL